MGHSDCSEEPAFNRSAYDLYDSYSECQNATSAALSNTQQYKGAFLEGFCNSFSVDQGLKFECDGNEAKILTYNDYECKTGVASTQSIDTSVNVHCNETLSGFASSLSLSAQCEIHSPSNENTLSTGLLIAIIIGASVVVIVVCLLTVYFCRRAQQKKTDKYQQFIN